MSNPGFKYSTRNESLKNSLWAKMENTAYLGKVVDGHLSDKDILEIANLHLELKPLFKRIHQVIDKRHAEYVIAVNSGKRNKEFLQVVDEQKKKL